MIAVDLETHEVLKNWESSALPSRNHTVSGLLSTVMNFKRESCLPPDSALLRHQIAFGYNTEDVEMVFSRWQARARRRLRYGDDIL